MAKTSAAGLDPIDRLEEKITLLVNTIVRLKGDQTRMVDDNARLQREMDTLKARLADAENATTEMSTLREERDLIRGRVTDMLEQLDGLSL